MTLLITVAEADAHLRLDLQGSGDSPPYSSDEQYADLVLKMEQAEALIANYLKVDLELAVNGDAGASPVVAPLWGDRDRANVQAAALFALSALYDDEAGKGLADYMAPAGVITLLLARLRDPAIA